MSDEHKEQEEGGQLGEIPPATDAQRRYAQRYNQERKKEVRK
jgi:hypothetical protein